ncbi:M14 family metallopeptidase [Pseudochryseolinea flava]|uniref:Carboxypeptidase n=1 Tax=Pseudochryseolinea flava TaxID=2059302 RepID=A0A364Y8W4_9BACT|nr:M14 family metallopeptidase [Pseudochryseolinea flava]RAW02925.1 carboxypeptidase [Pseudochryseolinea flava]
MIRTLLFLSCLICAMITVAHAQQEEILPPTQPWKGKSLSLVAKANDAWITPTETSNFQNTPSHEETIAWLEKLCAASEVLDLTTVGHSANGRKIVLVIASTDPTSVKTSSKPNVFVQAGIHAGEIDGKDAGMMLLRDIAFGKKRDLLKNVNFLFIPILNVDGHERKSPFNRVNQRGPSNMGWRTNARNLNLNRDYMKLDTEEIRTVTTVMNDYNTAFYVDLHVTDGADYQYDITYGYTGYSKSINAFLNTAIKPVLDKNLKDYGHIPGPLMFATNDRDFSQGNLDMPFGPRFSNNYGDLRRIPSILVENHSLKPFKQRVLGTYIFLEALLQAIGKEYASMKMAIEKDRNVRNESVVLTWTATDKPDTMMLAAIESRIEKSQVTNGDFVRWTGKTLTQKIPYIRYSKPGQSVARPKAYWIPATHQEVISRLIMHGVQVEKITTPTTVKVDLYRIDGHKFSNVPFEGHFSVTATGTKRESHTEVFYHGSVRVSTDQPLGDLAIHLLEPISPDSFFSWGFFPEIFTQTEYIEEYAIEPLARMMLAKDENLRKEFALKKQQDPKFLDDQRAVYTWFYERSPFVDGRYLLYPVGIEL